MKTLLISPHLDDAVFSAGQYIAANPGCTVVTVFAGIPKDSKLLTPYDEKTGFTSSEQALLARLGEDRAALKTLGAEPVYWDYLDSQYGGQPADRNELANRILQQAKGFDMVIGPIGILHPDHILLAECLRSKVALQTRLPLYVWADLPASAINEDLLAKALEGLEEEQPLDSNTPDKQSLDLKQLACQAYKSQWDQYDITPANVLVEERFWRVV